MSLSLAVFFFDKDNNQLNTVSIDCENKQKINCNDISKYTWLNENPLLIQTSTNEVYSYPTSHGNFLSKDGISDDFMVRKDKCYALKYWLAKERKIEVKIFYNVKNETSRDEIYSFKPKYDNKKILDHSFCLRNLTLLNAKEYVISISVNQRNFGDIRDYAFELVEKNDVASIWSLKEEMRYFLQEMKDVFNTSNKDSGRGHWKDEWTESEGFSFKEESVRFTGIENNNTIALI